MEYQDHHTDADTEVVGDGEYVEYGRAAFGPFIVEFQQGYHDPVFEKHVSAEWVINGPIIGQVVEKSYYGVEVEMMDAIGTWDYVERADKEVGRR
jgi:hypothetical protein